ncbi:hypothetical protein BX616_006152, partial [Lobosporangium transversale]
MNPNTASNSPITAAASDLTGTHANNDVPPATPADVQDILPNSSTIPQGERYQDMDIDVITEDPVSTPANPRSNEQILTDMNEKRRELTTRKAHLARLIAQQGSETVGGNIEKTLENVTQELRALEKRAEDFLNSVQEMESLATPFQFKKLKNEAVSLPSSTQGHLKVTDDMPRYTLGSSPRKFLDDVRHVVCTYVGRETFEKSCDRYLLYLTISDYHRRYLEQELKKLPEDQKTWEKCEATFLKIALTEQERTSQFNKLLEKGRGAHETYHQFAMRLDRDVRVYGVRDDNDMVISMLQATMNNHTLHIMIAMLQNYKKQYVTSFTHISDFIKILGNLQGPINLTTPVSPDATEEKPRPNGPMRHTRNKPRHNPMSKTAPNEESSNKRFYGCQQCGKNNTHNTEGHKQCSKCKARGHVASECTRRIGEYLNQPAISSLAIKAPSSHNEPYAKELLLHDQCITVEMESTPVTVPYHITTSSLSMSNATLDNDTHTLAKLHLNHEKADKRIVVYVNFEGEKYEALIDTGASVTCIRKNIALKHSKSITPVQGNITLADESLTIPRIGLVENVELAYGMDLFYQFGFGLSGCHNPGQDAILLPEPEEEQIKSFIKEKKVFMAKIGPELAKNARVPKQSYCTIPEMKVFLPIPE